MSPIVFQPRFAGVHRLVLDQQARDCIEGNRQCSGYNLNKLDAYEIGQSLQEITGETFDQNHPEVNFFIDGDDLCVLLNVNEEPEFLKAKADALQQASKDMSRVMTSPGWLESRAGGYLTEQYKALAAKVSQTWQLTYQQGKVGFQVKPLC